MAAASSRRSSRSPPASQPVSMSQRGRATHRPFTVPGFATAAGASCLRGMVVNVSPVRRYRNGCGKMFSIILEGSSNEDACPQTVRAAFFQADNTRDGPVDRYQAHLRRGTTYIFQGGAIKLADPRFNRCSSKYEIVFNNASAIKIKEVTHVSPTHAHATMSTHRTSKTAPAHTPTSEPASLRRDSVSLHTRKRKYQTNAVRSAADQKKAESNSHNTAQAMSTPVGRNIPLGGVNTRVAKIKRFRATYGSGRVGGNAHLAGPSPVSVVQRRALAVRAAEARQKRQEKRGGSGSAQQRARRQTREELVGRIEARFKDTGRTPPIGLRCAQLDVLKRIWRKETAH